MAQNPYFNGYQPQGQNHQPPYYTNPSQPQYGQQGTQPPHHPQQYPQPPNNHQNHPQPQQNAHYPNAGQQYTQNPNNYYNYQHAQQPNQQYSQPQNTYNYQNPYQHTQQAQQQQQFNGTTQVPATPLTHSNTGEVFEHCKKYYEENACGHEKKAKYLYCNRTNPRHDNNQQENEKCYHAHKPFIWSGRKTTVRSGMNYCSNAYKALVTGWLCCTCNFKYVTGRVERSLLKLVHDDPNGGQPHEFCTTCKSDFPAAQRTQNVNGQSGGGNGGGGNSFNLHLNAGNLSEMGVRGDRATGCAAGTDLYEGNTSPFQVGIGNEH